MSRSKQRYYNCKHSGLCGDAAYHVAVVDLHCEHAEVDGVRQAHSEDAAIRFFRIGIRIFFVLAYRRQCNACRLLDLLPQVIGMGR